MFDNLAADYYPKKLQDRHPKGTGEDTGEVEDWQGEDGKNEQSGGSEAGGHIVEKGVEPSLATDEIAASFSGQVARQFSQPTADAGNYSEENGVQVGAEGEDEGQAGCGQNDGCASNQADDKAAQVPPLAESLHQFFLGAEPECANNDSKDSQYL